MQVQFDIAEDIREKDVRQFTGFEPLNGRFQMKNYQIYAQRVFSALSNALRWFILDYIMGSGKTATALSIVAQTGGNVIVVGNDATQDSFKHDAKKMGIGLDNVSFTTVQRVSMMEKGELLRFFRYSYIIIDEFQRLFSQQGLNSYGEAFQFLFQHQLKDLKVICLSGTMFNSTASEMKYLLSIFGETYKTEDEGINILAKHTISWTKQDTTLVPTKEQIQQGPELIPGFGLVRCQMSTAQYEAYKKSENQETTGLSLTKYILPKYYYDGEKHEATKILKGDLISYENLKKHAPMAFAFISNLHNILSGKEDKKCAAYVKNIDAQFGLKQYVEILEHNGFIAYGKSPTADTLCFRCGKPYREHGATGSHTKAQFLPAVYSVYAAQTAKGKRDVQTEIYNSYQNRDGSQICLIMLTSIAETGLSLSCVNNFFILDNIPEISLFEQITARAVRFKSHMFLPPEKRRVKIYCFTVSAPAYKEITKHEQKWVEIYEEDQRIKQLYKTLRERDFNLLNEGRKDIVDVLGIAQFFTAQRLSAFMEFVERCEIQIIRFKEFVDLLYKKGLTGLEYNGEDLQTIFLIIRYYYRITPDLVCIRDVPVIERTNAAQDITLNYQMYDSIEPIIDAQKKIDLFYNLNQTQNTNAIRFYIKDFMGQGVVFKDEFYNNGNFTAFMIYENLCYIAGDEERYTENHLHLFKEIYDKDINYVRDHLKTLISKHKIQGYYQNNQVYTSKGLLFKTSNRPIEEKNLVQFLITKSLPQFKLIKNGYGYDCITLQPGFFDVFENERDIRQNDYERQNYGMRCRYILYYALLKDRVNIPDFISV